MNRLPDIGDKDKIIAKADFDQFGTFEVFVQSREGKPFQHEGAVHAPNLDMAFVLAKEVFTRRFTCVSLCVVDTRHVFVSPLVEGDQNVYNMLDLKVTDAANPVAYEIYHLTKRGKQHIHAGTINAANPESAVALAGKALNNGKPVLNVWAIRHADIRFTTPEEQDLWHTLPEKKFRDAADYKGGDKLKTFLEQQNHG